MFFVEYPSTNLSLAAYARHHSHSLAEGSQPGEIKPIALEVARSEVTFDGFQVDVRILRTPSNQVAPRRAIAPIMEFSSRPLSPLPAPFTGPAGADGNAPNL